MKNLYKQINEFGKKYSVIMILTLVIISTANSAYLNNVNSNLQKQLIEEQKPSIEEKTKETVDELYRDRAMYIQDNGTIKGQIDELLSKIHSYENDIELNNLNIFKTESMIRCEKANNWKENKDNCSENWENYPKK